MDGPLLDEPVAVDYEQMLDMIHAIQVDLMLLETTLTQHKPSTLPYVSVLTLEALHYELERGAGFPSAVRH